MQRTPVITVILSAEQAWAFAQFLKRVGLDDYRALAADLEEAWLMREAGEAIRCGLRPHTLTSSMNSGCSARSASVSSYQIRSKYGRLRKNWSRS